MSSVHPQSSSPESLRPWLEAARSLQSSERELLASALSPRWNVYLQRAAEVESLKAGKPSSFPSSTQTAFLLLDDVEEVLFGGAAGGGKSSALLAAGIQYVDCSEYRAFMFRRKYTDLEQLDGLIPRSHEWFGGTGWRANEQPAWNGDRRQWTFPSGAVLKFGYLENRADAYNYQGAAAHYFGFDESGLMDPWCMGFIRTRARRPRSSQVPIRFRYSANPGGEAHEWLYGRFIVLGGVDGRVFVPSRAVDNPGLDQEDYQRRLSEVEDPVLRAQMRDGDWTVRDRTNALVPEWTPEIEASSVVEVSQPKYFIPYVVGDLGSRDLTAFLFGYPFFAEDKLIVEDEWIARDPSTHEIGVSILGRAVELWGGFSSQPEDAAELLNLVRGLSGSPDAKVTAQLDRLIARVFGRHQPRWISDVDWRLVKDLRAYGIKLLPTKKDDSLGARNRARSRIGDDGTRINPRCEVLLRTLKTGLWNGTRTDFARNDEIGHADAWAALIYLNRNANFEDNPKPKAEELVVGRSVRPPELEQELAPAVRTLQGIFGGRKR